MKRFLYCIALVFIDYNKNWEESGGWTALFRAVGTFVFWASAAVASFALAGWFSYLTVGFPDDTMSYATRSRHGDLWAMTTMLYWMAEAAIFTILWRAHSICKTLPKEEDPS